MKCFSSLSEGLSYSIGSIIRGSGRGYGNKVLIVTSSNGAQRRSTNYLKYILTSNGIENYVISTAGYGDHSNKQKKGIEPCIETINRGQSLMSRFGSSSFAAVFAIGGPSTFDIAKALSVIYGNNENDIKNLAYTQNFDSINWNIPKIKINERRIPLISIPIVSSFGSDASQVSDFVDWKNDMHFKLISAAKPEVLIHDEDLVVQDNVPFSTNAILWITTLSRWCDLELMKNRKKEKYINENVQNIAKGLEKLANSGKIPSKEEQKQINKAAFNLSREIGEDWFSFGLKSHLESKESSPLPWNTMICETLSSHLPLSFSDLSASLWLDCMEANYLDDQFRGKEEGWKVISSSLTGNQLSSSSDALSWIKSNVGGAFHQAESMAGKLDPSQIQNERDFLVEHICRSQNVTAATVKEKIASILTTSLSQ